MKYNMGCVSLRQDVEMTEKTEERASTKEKGKSPCDSADIPDMFPFCAVLRIIGEWIKTKTEALPDGEEKRRKKTRFCPME